jgi:dTDP-4-amino-4,6-dideoxygalactose transaminase
MRVPLLELTTQNGALADELKAAAAKVIDSGRYIMGPEIEAFEEEVALYCGAAHGVSVSSGTDALLLTLMALGIEPEDEVIVPSFTFFATAGCVSRLGAVPVFADCSPTTFNLQASDIEPLITEKTKAIIPVHLFGQCAPLGDIRALAQSHNLAIIEDTAQATGARIGDKLAGSIGTAGTFSFFPSKNLGGLGDSGLITTQDEALAEKMRILRMHGSAPKYYHSLIGGNFRMDPLQAALLRLKLPLLDDYIAARRKNAELYFTILAEVDSERLILPSEQEGHFHTYNQFTLRLPGDGRRDKLREHLASSEIGAEIYYPLCLHQQACFAGLPSASRSLPHSEQLAKEVLSIPIYPELSEAQIGYVCQSIKGFLDLEGR